jgi:hypothetical protein
MELMTLKYLQTAKRFQRSEQLNLFQQPQNMFANLVVKPHEKSSMEPFSRLFGS